jgi:hypothetical protein
VTSDLLREARASRRVHRRGLRATGHRLLVTLFLLSCQASTNRPPYDALPSAALAEVELDIPSATRILAEALRADSLPVSKIEERDGFLDSGWFDAGSLTPTSRMPVGTDVVRIRAWATPTKFRFVELQIETVYRPLVDPSRPERDLEIIVPPDHAVQRRVNGVIRRLLEQHGDTAHAREFQPLRPPPQGRPDSIRPDSVKRDTSVSLRVALSPPAPPISRFSSGRKPGVIHENQR